MVLAAAGAVKASGEVSKGFGNHVVKCRHYPKGGKEPLKGFKYTKNICVQKYDFGSSAEHVKTVGKETSSEGVAVPQATEHSGRGDGEKANRFIIY